MVKNVRQITREYKRIEVQIWGVDKAEKKHYHGSKVVDREKANALLTYLNKNEVTTALMDDEN
jgi:hypothetical protein